MTRILIILALLWPIGSSAAELPILDVDRFCAPLGKFSSVCVAREQSYYDALREVWDQLTPQQQAGLRTFTTYQGMVLAAGNALYYQAMAMRFESRRFRP